MKKKEEEKKEKEEEEEKEKEKRAVKMAGEWYVGSYFSYFGLVRQASSRR
jgi:hypothetical protein